MIVSWYWEFGDGKTSTLPSPVHVYRMPGVYIVRLTTTDEDGSTSTYQTTIYAYDYEYSEPDGLWAPVTDYCMRHSIKASQGEGIVEFTGAAWLWPPAVVGAATGFNDQAEAVTVVMDSRTGRFYEIGIPELWTDRTNSYGGTEIATRARLPEYTAAGITRGARQGEHAWLRHVETHLFMRSWDERAYKNAVGYTEDGFRDAHQVSLRIYVDGEQITPRAKLENVQRLGDYTYREFIEHRRLQQEILTTTAAFRCVGGSTHLQASQRKAAPQYNYTTESQRQREFVGQDFWLSRNKPTSLTNRATGTVCSGAIDSTATGPDQKDGTATLFNAAGYAGATLGYTTGDFTLCCWLGLVLVYPAVVWRFAVQGGGTLTVTITTAGATKRVTWDDGTNVFTDTLTWNGSSWVQLALRRSSTTLAVIENGVVLAQHTVALRQYGGASRFADGAVVSTFDPRRVLRAVSVDALLWYYDDVLNNGGQGGCLP